MPSLFDIITKLPVSTPGEEPSEILSPNLLFLSGHPKRYSGSKTKKAALHVAKYMKEVHGIGLIIDACKTCQTQQQQQNQNEEHESDHNHDHSGEKVNFFIETIATGEVKKIDTVQEFVALMKNDQLQEQTTKQPTNIFFHMTIALQDEPTENITKFFEVVNFVLTNALHEGLQQQQQQQQQEQDKAETELPAAQPSGFTRTLVHCQAGASRSASLVAAFIMKYFAVSDSEKVLDFMESRRNGVDPNEGFRKKLKNYEEKCRSVSPTRSPSML